MVPDVNAPIQSIGHDNSGYYALTARQQGREEPYRIALTKQQYQQFDGYGQVQLMFLGLYIGIILLFRRYYYDPKRWLNQNL